jgi:hypothetical protein
MRKATMHVTHAVALTASLFNWMSLFEEMAAVEYAVDNSVVLASFGRLSTAPSQEIHVNIPDTPTYWQPPTQKVDKGEPAFVGVHNPGVAPNLSSILSLGPPPPNSTSTTVCPWVRSQYP